MAPITTLHYLVVAAALFILGVIGVLTRRNVVIVLMSIELILNAVNLNLVAFSRLYGLHGQVFAIFVITDAAAEAAVHGLAEVRLLRGAPFPRWSRLHRERGRASHIRDEPVPATPDRLQLDSAGSLEGTTDERDVVLEVVRLDEGVGPEAFLQFLATYDAARVFEQDGKHLERLAAEP